MEFLNSLVTLKLPDGEFSLRAFIDSPMTLMGFFPNQIGAHLSITLSPDELATVASCIEQAQEFLTSTEPSNAVGYLGWCAPRPLACRLVAIHYRDRRQVLMFSFYQNNRVFDAMLDLESQQKLLEVIRTRQRQLPTRPSRSGRFEAGVGLVLDSGEQPLRLDGLTHFWGPYGEFFQSTEICSTIPAQVDCIEIEGKLFALRAKASPRSRVTPQMPNESPEFVQFCRNGATSDDLLMAGSLAAAAQARRQLIEQMRLSGKVDTYLLSKAALSRLLSQILCADFRPALQDYSQMQQAQDLEGLGLMMLAKGQVAFPDVLLYSELEATLISIEPQLAAGEDPVECIDAAMSETFAFAHHQQDPWLAALILRNWKLHLSNLFQGQEIPAAALAEWNSHQEQFPVPVQPKILCFRWPDIWHTEQDVLVTLGPQGVVKDGSTPAKSGASGSKISSAASAAGVPTAASETTSSGKPWWKRIFGA